AEREAYRARRREEGVKACAILGLAGCDSLDLPDGALAHHLDAAAEGIRRAVLTQRPELLLVPSPLEISRDHRAAFAALHRLLGGLRGREGANTDTAADPLASNEVLGRLRILAYEVNHPVHPDLLVDVSAQAD